MSKFTELERQAHEALSKAFVRMNTFAERKYDDPRQCLGDVYFVLAPVQQKMQALAQEEVEEAQA